MIRKQNIQPRNLSEVLFCQVCKIDMKTKGCLEWQEENCYPSEPVFVAKPDGTEEDDGTLNESKDVLCGLELLKYGCNACIKRYK